MTKQKAHWQGYFFILLAAGLWGSVGPVAKLAFSQGLAPLQVAFFRAMFGWLFFLGHALISKSGIVKYKDLPFILVFSLLCVTIFYGAYQLAIAQAGAAVASVLLYTAPAWVTILARIFLKEHITLSKMVALGLTISGVVLISFSSNLSLSQANISPKGLFFGLLSGLTYALYYIFGKKALQHYNTLTIFSYILPLGSLPLLFFIPWTWPSNAALLTLIFLGFSTTYLAYLAYYRGLKYLEASKAAVVATLEPVIAAVLAFFYWDEVLNLTGYLGSALILLAVLLTILRDHPPSTA